MNPVEWPKASSGMTPDQHMRAIAAYITVTAVSGKWNNIVEYTAFDIYNFIKKGTK